MRKTRRILSFLIGAIQFGIGGLASILTYLIYSSSSLREALAISSEEIYLFMLISAIFGVLSIASGLLLIQQKEKVD